MADNTQRVIWGRERDECVRLMAEMLVQHLVTQFSKSLTKNTKEMLGWLSCPTCRFAGHKLWKTSHDETSQLDLLVCDTDMTAS